MISFVQFDTTPNNLTGSYLNFRDTKINAHKDNIGANFDDIVDSRKNAAEIRKLQERDKEVKEHELAHRTVGGRYTGSSTFKYKLGPDMNRYATDGNTPIDVSEAISAEETISKMKTVKKAALAPVRPSNTDRRIAMDSDFKKTRAMNELMEARHENRENMEQFHINVRGNLLDKKV